MSVFGGYSRYYNLLYRDKDYAAETSFVLSLLSNYSASPVKTILDVGCGTGKHAFLAAAQGYDVEGVDRSAEMIRVAQEKAKGLDNPRFRLGDAESLDLGRQFDAIVSLFHVVSYQTTDEQLRETFRRAHEHLAPGGVLLFDFWHGPGVLSDPPVVRVKRMEDDSVRILRVATPEIDSSRNVVEIHYELWIEDKASRKVEQIEERHRVRFLFRPELETMLENTGFQVCDFLEWMSPERPPGTLTWNACAIALKRENSLLK